MYRDQITKAVLPSGAPELGKKIGKLFVEN